MFEAEKCLHEHIHESYPVAAAITKIQWSNIRADIIKEQPTIANDVGLLRTAVLSKGFMLAGMDPNMVLGAVSDCFEKFYFKRSDFKVSKSVHKTLKHLSKQMPIAAITNGNVNCEAIGIAQYFSCIIHASPQHPMKPHNAMFDLLAEELNIPSKNILHVGDDLEKDIKGATNAGYQSAWLAVNRTMNLTNESASMLPHIQLRKLKDLRKLIK
jgi:putative hydrolase of the HAD superfamily